MNIECYDRMQMNNCSAFGHKKMTNNLKVMLNIYSNAFILKSIESLLYQKSSLSQ